MVPHSRSTVSISRPAEVWLLGGLLAALIAFHAATLHRQAWFVDEANEIAIAALPVGQILFEPDSMPPLYSILLKGWIELTAVDQARWLSAIFGVFSVLALRQYVRILFDPVTALVAAGLLAVFPLQLYYAQFVRAYSLLTLLAIVAMGELLLAWRREDSRHWIGFAVASTAGLYTHYYFGPLLVTLLGICLWRSRRPPLPLLGAIGSIAVASLPLLVIVANDFAYQRELREPRHLDLMAVAYTYANYFAGYSLGPSVPELHTLAGRAAAREFAPWGILIVATSVPLALAGMQRLAWLRLAGAVVAVLIVPLLLIGILGAILGLTYNPRFVAWGVAPLTVLLAVGMVGAWPRWWGRLATLVLIAVMLVAVTNRTLVGRYQNEDLRSACEYLHEHGAPGESVLLVSDYLDRAIGHYLPSHLALVLLPHPGETNQVVRSQETALQAVVAVENLWEESSRQGGWLVYSRPFHGDPAGTLLKELTTHFHLTEVAIDAPGVRLFRVAPLP